MPVILHTLNVHSMASDLHDKLYFSALSMKTHTCPYHAKLFMWKHYPFWFVLCYTYTMQVFHYAYHSIRLTDPYNILVGQVCHAHHLYWCGPLKCVMWQEPVDMAQNSLLYGPFSMVWTTIDLVHDMIQISSNGWTHIHVVQFGTWTHYHDVDLIPHAKNY